MFPGSSSRQAVVKHGDGNDVAPNEDSGRNGTRLPPSFRDCAGNVSSFPREVTETALAHVVGDKAEQAYPRSDALDTQRN